MKLAIMQPYFFPYLGYFQLIHAVDTFVVYDDVNFIKGGWINRNYILSHGQKVRITLQLLGASPNRLINQISVAENRGKLLRTLQQNYARAPYLADVLPMLEEILGFEESNLAVFLDLGLRRICDYLNICPRWCRSSNLQKDNSLRGQDKILAICKELGAKHYINVPGGKILYDHASFTAADIRLSFIEPRVLEYRQSGHEFVPYLSIIDILMFNNQQQCQRLLERYKLV